MKSKTKEYKNMTMEINPCMSIITNYQQKKYQLNDRNFFKNPLYAIKIKTSKL